MNDHPHSHDEPRATPPPSETPLDAGSQALSEALRSSFAIVRFVMIGLLLVFFGSGFFQVGPQERAMKLRFGKPVGEGEKALLGPGLHWSWPYPIEQHVKVSISGIQQIRSTAGWYFTTDVQEAAGTEPPVSPGTPLNPAVDGYALTADGNIIHTRATLHYRIEDPIRFVFGFVNASNVIQNTLNNALLSTAARFNVDQILFSDIAGYRDAVLREATRLLEQQDTGIAVENCIVDSIPPRQLKAVFDGVVAAGQVRRKVLDEARSYENQVLSKAGADATSLTNAAQTARVQLVNNTASQARWFSDLLPQYEANPRLFTQQRLTETMERVLANAEEKFYLPARADGNTRELRILSGRERLKPLTGTTNQP